MVYVEIAVWIIDLAIHGIYIGSVGAAINRPALLNVGITHIITIPEGLRPMFPDDFSYYESQLKEDPSVNALNILPDAFEFID